GRMLTLDGPSMRTTHLGLDDPTVDPASTQVASVSGKGARISGIDAPEFPEPTVSSRLRKTTKPLARPSRSLPGIRQTFSSWSRTQRSTPRPAGGDTVTSARTVRLAATRCSRLVPPATRRLFAILSSPVTRVDGPARRQPTYPAVLQVSTSSARRGNRCGEAHNKQAQAEGGRPMIEVGGSSS